MSITFNLAALVFPILKAFWALINNNKIVSLSISSRTLHHDEKEGKTRFNLGIDNKTANTIKIVSLKYKISRKVCGQVGVINKKPVLHLRWK